MTVESFIENAEKYYGEYKPAQKHYVYDWLSKHGEKTISHLFGQCLKMVEAKYKQPPCIADLEKAYTVNRGRPELMPKPQLLLEEDAMPTEEAVKLLRDLMTKLARKAKR